MMGLDIILSLFIIKGGKISPKQFSSKSSKIFFNKPLSNP